MCTHDDSLVFFIKIMLTYIDWLNPHLKIEIPFSLSVMAISLTSYIQQGQGNRILRLTTKEGSFYPCTYAL